MKHVLSTHLFVSHRLTTVWLDRIWQAGIPAVEFFCARQHLDWRNRAQLNELKHWFRDSELELFSVHGPIYTDEVWGRSGPKALISITETSKPRRLDAVDEIKRALEIAESIPFRYLVLHLGANGEEYDDHKFEAAFAALEEIHLFAHGLGVEVLLENITNSLSSAERLLLFLNETHLDMNFCFDTGHAHMTEGIRQAYSLMKERIRSTHVHDNDGKSDMHLFPLLAQGGTIDWRDTMSLLRSRPDQYPLLLELRESEDFPHPIESAREVFDRLEGIE